MNRRPLLRNNRGQMALVLIFIAAIGLIFYAMTLNIGKLSQSRLQVTIAANQSASGLASQLASYGEQTMQTSLGGEREKCAWSGVFSAIISFIIIIIIIIISVVTHQYELWTLIVMIVAAVLALAAIFIQACVVQPKITSLWNKMQANIQSQEDSFIQSALQQALRYAASDNKSIPDILDYDMDGKSSNQWTGLNFKGGVVPDNTDTTTRFAYYYTQFLEQFENPVSTLAGTFQQGVRDILQGLGLDDKACTTTDAAGIITAGGCTPNCSTGPQQFVNPCCVVESLRPKNCPNPLGAMCNTTYGGYTLAYDSLFCNRQTSAEAINPVTGVHSPALPRLLGRDDGNTFTEKVNANDPASNEKTWTTPPLSAQPTLAVPQPAPPSTLPYRGEDSDGIMIPLFWTLHDTAPYIYDLNNPTAVVANDASCHWCTVPACDATYRFRRVPPNIPNALVPSLSLSLGCSGATCCTNRFRSDTVNVATFDSRIIDKVGSINGFVETNYTGCPGSSGGIWRYGSDDFCTTTPPYNAGDAIATCYTPPCPPNPLVSGTPCLKHNMALCGLTATGAGNDCSCATSSAQQQPLWHNDIFDDFLNWLREIVPQVRVLLGSAYANQLISTVSEWGPNAKATLCELDNLASSTCPATLGWKQRMEAWATLIDTWLSPTPGYQATAGEQLWCLPNNVNDLSGLPANLKDEQYLVAVDSSVYNNIAASTAYGDMNSVLRCLSYNTFNAVKFKNCMDFCNGGTVDPAIYVAQNAVQCKNLPRSLLPAAGADINTTIAGQTCNVANALISNSYTLAQDQVPKITKRFNYLNAIVQQATLVSRSLHQFVANIGTRPSDLTSIITQMEQNITGVRVDNTLIYGWKSDPTPLMPTGAWHVVQVQAWAPKRCEGYDLTGGLSLEASCCADRFPWVKTAKQGELKRCYFMQAHSGRVKVRVARYDQTGTNSLNFHNNVPLWTFRNNNPYDTDPSVVPDLAACEFKTNVALPLHRDWDKRVAADAFMIHSPGDYDPYSNGGRTNPATCRAAVKRALQKSVVSESCAVYYLQGDTYKLRFSSCNKLCSPNPPIGEGIQPNAR